MALGLGGAVLSPQAAGVSSAGDQRPLYVLVNFECRGVGEMPWSRGGFGFQCRVAEGQRIMEGCL